MVWLENLEDGEVYSNLKLNDDTATMPLKKKQMQRCRVTSFRK